MDKKATEKVFLLLQELDHSLDDLLREQLLNEDYDRIVNPPEEILYSKAEAIDDAIKWLSINTRKGKQKKIENPIEYFKNNHEDFLRLVLDWCKIEYTKLQLKLIAKFHKFSRTECLRVRKFLFPKNKNYRFQYTIWSDKSPSYSWAIDHKSLILPVFPKKTLLQSIGSENQPYKFSKISLTKTELDELSNLEKNFQKSEIHFSGNRLGSTLYGLIEFPIIRKYICFDYRCAIDGQATNYLLHILSFVERIQEKYFSDLEKWIYTISSSIPKMPVDFLEKTLRNENPIIIAYLYLFIHSENLKEFIIQLPENIKEQVMNKVDSISKSEFNSEIFREVERVLERKYALYKDELKN
ncbi:MAG: hypothetical protein SFU98_20755 [Leptospiraceae bacterium]|nr:hypothetical protein [Leptospiraceae bacterium]